ncbi:MAG TPA: peroxiredoxin [Burkholderiaceae bacterium]|nr:peroxiredoxin [Burkholderiaceae bacterium]
MKAPTAALFAACVLGAAMAVPARAELKVGDPAPDFTAPAALAGQPFKFALADALKKGPVVLYFYPKAFTSGCTIEANRFAEAHDDYAALGATVIGVSGDDIETLQRFSTTECRNKFAVAADHGGRIMKSYDAAMPFSTSYARRISYVISPDGRIAYAYSSMSPEQHAPNTLDAVRRWAATARGQSSR